MKKSQILIFFLKMISDPVYAYIYIYLKNYIYIYKLSKNYILYKFYNILVAKFIILVIKLSKLNKFSFCNKILLLSIIWIFFLILNFFNRSNRISGLNFTIFQIFGTSNILWLQIESGRITDYSNKIDPIEYFPKSGYPIREHPWSPVD